MKKKITLLFAVILALMGGVNKAWAEEITEDFNSVTLVDAYGNALANTYSYGSGLSNGWKTSEANKIYASKDATDYGLATGGRNSSKALWAASSGTNSTSIIIPVKVQGELSFYAVKSSSSTTSGSAIKIFEVTEADGTYTVTSTQLGSTVNPTSTTWTQYTVNLGDGAKYIAINMVRAGIDDFTYNTYKEGPALTVYSDEAASDKVKSGATLDFGLTESAASVTYYLKNTGTSDMSNLAVSHTGNATLGSLSTTTVASGNQVALTITQAATGTTSDVVTITADSGLSFTLNVSGTIRDASKMFVNFSGGETPAEWDVKTSWTIADGYAYNTVTSSYSNATDLISPYIKCSDGEKLYFKVKKHDTSSSYNAFALTVYTTPDLAWSSYETYTLDSNLDTEWATLSVPLSASVHYICFRAKNIEITDIYGGQLSAEPILSLSQSSFDFGLITESTTSSEITISNTGKSALKGLNIVSDNGNFTANVTGNATEIAVGETATFTVTMGTTSKGAQTATITIKSDNADDLTFTASGAVAKEGTLSEDFEDQKVPSTWTSTGTWKAGNGSEIGATSAATMTTPAVKVEEGDFLAIKVRNYGAYTDDYIQVESYDGSSWTVVKKIMSTEFYSSSATTTLIVDLPTTAKQLRFTAYYAYIDEIAGLRYAPVLTVTDSESAVQTSGLTYAFGEVGADKAVTYRFNNTGAGTINITNVESDNAVFTTNWTASVAADNYDLTITANYNAEKAGEQNGKVTVTTTEGAFEINLTSTFLAANAPKFAVLIGETEQTTGASLDFGIITADATKEFVIKNDGTGALSVTAITLPEGITADKTASEATPLTVDAGAMETVTLTLAATAKKIISNAEISITATGFDDPFTFKVNATVMPGTEVVDFAGNKLPDNWTSVGSWTYTTGAAYSTTNNETDLIISPKVKFNDNDFIVLKAKGGDNSTTNFVSIRTSTDNGATWTTLKKINQSATTFTNSDFSTIVVDGISSSVNKIAFASYWAYIDDIAGLIIDDNDPRLGIYTDAECTTAATTAETKDFGFVTANATATYHIKNDGTGTMTLSLGDQPAGFTAELGSNSLTAGQSTTLTITMPAENKGYHEGNVVVTATDLGTFTVAVSGVQVDESKLNLDFTSDNIPSNWTKSNWTKNASGYIENSNWTSGSIETSALNAVAGEEIIIEAKMMGISYNLGVNYKKSDEESWSTLIEASNIGTNWVLLRKTIQDAGSYQLQFVGTRAQIRRIYGLTEPTEPIMAIYDGEDIAAATYDFGSVTNDADVTHVFTVKNEGKATLEGLKAELSGDQTDHFKVEIAGLTDGNVAAGASATITVTQLKDNLGAHAATLTISSTSEGIDDKVIALSGTTRDASKLFVDFQSAMPSDWTASGWSRTYTGTNYYAQAGYSQGTLTTPALTIAAGEKITFDAKAQYSGPTFKVRYTTDGAVTWTEKDLASSINNSTWTTLTLDLENTEAVAAFIQFVGQYAQLDNFYGGTVTTAPMIALTEGSTAVENGSTKAFGNLTAEGTATYTLTNSGTAALVSTVAATTVKAEISGDDVTINDNKVTIPAGKSATITVTLPFEAPYGDKEGSMTITSENGVGTLTVNYTATTIDPTALYVDFDSEQTWPAGWYHASDWTVANSSTDYYARNYSSSTASDFITQKLTVADADDALTFKAAAYGTYYTSKLTISYSADRVNWTEIADQPTGFTTSYQTFTVKGVPAGDYYLKFSGNYLYIDEIAGWHKVTGIEHDLYVSASNIPADVIVPETSITATATVNSLIAAETGVYAKLLFGEAVVATADAADIALNGSKAFTLTGNVPATEGTYAAKIVVYYSDETVVFETATTDVKVAHTRTLAIQSFERDGEGTIEADANNQISPVFKVTVQNTGSTSLTPIIKVKQGETVVGTATGTALAANATSEAITVTAANMSAGEGGELSFTAEAYWSDAVDAEAFAYATPVTITVTASAPKFELAVKDGATVADGDAVAFGLVKEATTKTYTIKNSGTKELELVSIVAPTGFTATELTESNKTIAANGTLDIDVTLNDAQGKVAGDLVFTYKVDASTNKTFTLALSGRSISADTWTEDFASGIPATWTNNNWEWNSTRQAAYSGYSKGHELMTPRLKAEANEELTFDVYFPYSGEQLKVQYSTDRETWNEVATYSSTANEQTLEGSFTAPAAGNYYLKFGDSNSRYVYIDNLVGFKLDIPEHDTEIATSSVPTTGTQYGDYTATVTLKENAGKAEDVTAALVVNNVEVATKTETITANGSTTVTITWEPQEAIETAVEAYIKVTYAETKTLETAKVSLTISEATTLKDTEGSNEISTGTYSVLVLDRPFAEGWTSVSLPFAVDDVEEFFGEGAVAYEYTAFEDGLVTLKQVTSLSASYPYVVYVKTAKTEPIILKNIEITYGGSTPGSRRFGTTGNEATFQGTYAPIAAGEMTGKYSVTSDGTIAKGSAKAELKGFRAYFTVSSEGSIKAMRFIDDTATSVRTIRVDAEELGDVFDLGGRKVNTVRNGIYVVNGKKVLVK